MMALAGVDPGPGLLDVPHLLPLLLDWWMGDKGSISSGVDTPGSLGPTVERAAGDGRAGMPGLGDGPPTHCYYLRTEVVVDGWC